MSDPTKPEDNYSVKQLQTAKASVIQILSDLDTASSQWASEAVPAVYTIAVDEARGDLGVSVSGQFGTVHRQAAQILAETSYSRIADVLTLAGRQVTDIWRQVQLGRNLAGGALGYETWRQTRDKLQQSLRDGGITAFVDRSGKKWNLKSYASMLSRTELMNVHNEAKRTEFMEHGEDLVIVSSHPGTCEKCAPWQGRVLSLSGKTPGYPTLDQAEDAGLFHPNCVVAGTEISGASVLAHDTRWYVGQVFTIETTGGHELTCTPNHPILTPKGWVPARLLNIGDKVVQYAGKEGILLGIDPNEIQIPTLIEDIPGALLESGSMMSIRMPVAAENFHGDGADGQVDIVGADGFLRDGRETDILDPFLEDLFGGVLVGQHPFSSKGFLAKIFKGFGDATHSVMGVFGQLEPFLRGHSTQPDCHSLAPIWSRHDPALLEPLVDGHFCDAKAFCNVAFCLAGLVSSNNVIHIKRDPSTPGGSAGYVFSEIGENKPCFLHSEIETCNRDIESLCNLIDSLSRQIKLLDVVNVKISNFSGHVYNLQTRTGWYACNSIITHNCRHAYSLYIPDEGETAADTHVKEATWRVEADAEDAAWREAEEEKRRKKEEAKRWKINREKQNRHMEGTKEYREYAKKLKKEGLVPSCLTITSKELRRIIDEREGEWEPLPSSGKSGEKWRVKLTSPIGKWYDKNGQGPFDSEVLILAPSKTGLHCYPGNPSEGR